MRPDIVVIGGGTVGAAIAYGLAKRRDRTWVEGHFAEPQKFSPGSTMPPYRLAPKDLERLTSYLMMY